MVDFRKLFSNLYRPASLRFRLTALVLAITVFVLLATTAFIGNRAVIVIERDSNEQLNAASRTLAATVSVWLESHLNALRNLVSLPDIVSMKAERQRPLLRKMAAAYPYMYLICTTDLKGINVARNDDEKPKDYSDRDWVREARRGEPVVFQSLIGKTSNRPALTVSMPIKNEAGRVIGVGMFTTDLEHLTQQVQAAKMGKTGFAYLVDRQNRVLAHPDPAFASELRDLGVYPPVAALRQGTRGPVNFSDETGRRWRAYVTELNNGWGIVVQQQYEELLSTRRLFQRVTLAIILVAVLVLTFVTWLVARRALQPIEALTEAVTSVASNNANYPDFEALRQVSLHIKTRDEVGTLAESFSQMAVRLQATLASLEQELYEHKRTEVSLRDSEGKYRTLVNNVNIGVYRNTGGPQGRFVQANPAIAKMFGYDSVDEFLGITVSDLYQDPEERKRFVEELVRNGFVKDRELALRKKDGTPIWCSVTAAAQHDENGDVKFMDGVVEDITERKQAEESLRESEKKFRELFEESKDVIFISSPKGKFIDINRAGIELAGYSSKEEILGIDIAKDIYDTTEARIMFQSELEKRGFVKDYEVIFKRKDGDKLTVLMTATAVRDANGNITAYRGIIRDVTNQRRLEAQLMQAQKMEAIGQLSGGIAHDFNNILTAIMGYASLLKSKTKQDAVLQSYVDQVLTASTRAKNLTKNLLAFSRRQVMNPRPVNVNEIITSLEKMLIQLIREDIELKTLLAPEDLTIMADNGQIEQVLINLVANARDAMPQGGALTIETKLVEINEKYSDRHLFAKQGRHACISVTDTGTGMDEKTKAKLFEPFFTTKEIGRGTGLGLSIVYGIIKQHNGNINVYSEPGLGTTFKIYFPMIKSKPEKMQPQELPEPKGGTETILLAEDDADVRNLAKTILAEAGYRVLEATDGEDAIKVFAEHQDAIQLVLLDVIMPKKNGKEVHNWIKTARPGTKVLFMSGYSADIIFKKGVLEEGLNLISKPVTPPELLNKVREVLDKKSEFEKTVVGESPKIISEPAPPDRQVSAAAEAAGKKSKHKGFIIVVDDDANVLEYVSLMLEENGYATFSCNNAHDAVNKLKDTRVDAVLTDIVMPGTSGLELLETVRNIDPDMPVILVTAYADLSKAVESVKKGAYDFIMKPYEPEQLLRSLDKAVRYRRLVRLEKEYQNKLEEFNKEMETLVAERSMNLMALTVADRVRNPATVIGLACKKIIDKKVPAELKKYVSFIRDESDKLKAIVKSFQNLLGSRRSMFGYEDVNEVVKNVISLIEKESTQKGIKLILHLAEQPLKINMQKDLWRIAVQHVLRNAIEATPAGGEVTVTTTAENDKVTLAVTDTGSGIPGQDKGKIFDPFYSTKSHRYGMGLPLVKQIVSEHLGVIALTSEPGKGTTFRMVFSSRWQEK